MLETLESEKRAANLIVTGLPEGGMEGAETDADRVRQVMEAIGQRDVEVRSVERLGELRRAGRRIPVPVPTIALLKSSWARPATEQRFWRTPNDLKQGTIGSRPFTSRKTFILWSGRS